MNVKRILIGRDQHIHTVRERVHRQRLGKTAPNVQEHKQSSCAVEERDSSSAWSRTQQSVSLSSAAADLCALTTGIAEGMVKNLLKNSKDDEARLKQSQ